MVPAPLVSLVAAALWVVGSYLHTETYVWQSTTFAAWVRPVRRTECRLASHGFDGRVQTQPPAAAATERSPKKVGDSRSRSPRITLLYLYDGSARGGNGNDGGQSWNDQLMRRVIRNRQVYASRHGYTLVNANALIDPAWPAAWSKLKAVDHYLLAPGKKTPQHTNDTATDTDINPSGHPRPLAAAAPPVPPPAGPPAAPSASPHVDHDHDEDHDRDGEHYVMYVDMDVVIMDLNRRVEEFIDVARAANPQADFVMGEDWNGPNTGVWLARGPSSGPRAPGNTGSNTRNTSSDGSGGDRGGGGVGGRGFASWFLRTAFAQASRLSPKREQGSGRPHPFEYEQRAFHYLLGTPLWQGRGLKPFQRPPPHTPDAIRRHFQFFPQCAFNAYSLHPWDYRGDREQAQYVPGDFLVHFAGKKGMKKVHLMEHYLTAVERTYGGVAN